jgi:AraC-like DNA-binding protein
MDLICEERPSDSPYVELIWRSRTEHGGPFISMAESHWGICVTRYRGRTTFTVRGPETRATPAYGPEGAEFFGIIFKNGAFMPDMPAAMVRDRRDLNLPDASSTSFWLDGSAWQYPDFDNADTFVDRLVRVGLLVHDPVVASSLQSHLNDLSRRSVQRRFLRATALTQNEVRQIQRARKALALLTQGMSILDVVYLAGYFDQSHMTRSLKHFIGQTPAQITSRDRTMPLSFQYQTMLRAEELEPV